jgi:C-terminal region of aryl-sulfatase
MALLEGKGPSARKEILYFGGAELGAVRVENFKYQFYTQPDGWPGPKVTTDMPLIYNIRQDPFERTPILNFAQGAPAWFNEFFGRVRLCSASRGRARRNRHRFSADAGARILQP